MPSYGRRGFLRYFFEAWYTCWLRHVNSCHWCEGNNPVGFKKSRRHCSLYPFLKTHLDINMWHTLKQSVYMPHTVYAEIFPCLYAYTCGMTQTLVHTHTDSHCCHTWTVSHQGWQLTKPVFYFHEETALKVEASWRSWARVYDICILFEYNPGLQAGPGTLLWDNAKGS